MMIKNGIDVSEWQGTIDWTKVKADYAIIRAGYGRLISQKDKTFERNYAGAKAAGIPCGAYWYSYAQSEEEARTEAAVCLEVLKGKQFEYPIYIDIEEKRTLNLGMQKVSAIINAFLRELEKAGYFCGIYMSANPLMKCVNEATRRRYTVWVAHYGVSKPGYSGQYGMWQKASDGSHPGVAGNVDVDECYVDFPSIIKAKGDNGFPKPTAPAVKKTMKVTVEYDDHIYSGLLEEE